LALVLNREIQYAGGVRYPHLERIPGTHDYLSEILQPKNKKNHWDDRLSVPTDWGNCADRAEVLFSGPVGQVQVPQQTTLGCQSVAEEVNGPVLHASTVMSAI
jgi:hypothetical protein